MNGVEEDPSRLGSARPGPAWLGRKGFRNVNEMVIGVKMGIGSGGPSVLSALCSLSGKRLAHYSIHFLWPPLSFPFILSFGQTPPFLCIIFFPTI